MERVHINASQVHGSIHGDDSDTRQLHARDETESSLQELANSERTQHQDTAERSVEHQPEMSSDHPARRLELDITNAQTEIRRDYLHEYYVLVAPKRKNRPYDTSGSEHLMVESADSPRLDLQPSVLEIPSTESGRAWDVKVVQNKYPALTLDNPHAYGKQEIVIDTPLSNTPFGKLDVAQITTILQAYRQRSTELHKNTHIKYVSIFRNDGYEAGASLAHAHSQIIALPIAPPQIVHEAEACAAYFEKFNTDPYDAIIAFEQKNKLRIIDQNEDWIAVCPYASKWQMEAWILPKRTMQLLDEAQDQELTSVASLLTPLTKALSNTNISYNLIIEQGIIPSQRLTLKLCGRNVMSPWGGLEVATGVIVNVIPPESAAAWYRSQI